MLGYFIMQVGTVVLYVVFILMGLFLHVIGKPTEEMFIYTIMTGK